FLFGKGKKMIIKRIHYYLTFLFTLLATGVTLAQDGLAPLTPAIGDKLSLLTPPLTDKSISYLSQLFGSVGNVLHGTSGSLLAQVFNVFNLGLLLIAGTFASYTVFKSVLSTAQDGEFMG